LKKKALVGCLAVVLLGHTTLIGCVTPESPGKVLESKGTPETTRVAQETATAAPSDQRTYKRTVAIGRFSNETMYGRGIFVDSDLDPLGKQASDILATELIRSGEFIVFERPDVEKIEREQNRTGSGSLVGVNTLILGSVTEFGRSSDGQKGFLSSTKTQEARARVNLRLIDVSTGRAFFTADGVGTARKESGEVAGFGGFSAYDRTLNDRAISAAIVDLMDEVINELDSRPWRTFILDIDGTNVFLAGGQTQGLSSGDELLVFRKGKTIKSPQTGLPIELPGTNIAKLRVLSTFGETEVDEGSVAEVVSGSLESHALTELFVVESTESSSR